MSDNANEDDQEKGKIKDDEVDDIRNASARWDYVIVFGHVEPPEHMKEESKKAQHFMELRKKRRQIIETLKQKSVGLKISKKKSDDGKTMYLLITAPLERLEHEAEQLEMPMKLLAKYGGGYAPFQTKVRDRYETDPDDGLFRRTQRLYLIETIITDVPENGGANLNMDELIHTKVVSKFFPLHQEKRLKELYEGWVRPNNFWRRQPLDMIRTYFGENVSLYFAWVGFYTECLWASSIVGIICSILFWIGTHGTSNWGYWAYIVFGVYLAVWASIFLELWKRLNHKLNYYWGMFDYENLERTRPSFHGEVTQGVYHEDEWIDLSAETYGLEHVPTEKYYPPYYRYMKIAAGVPVLTTLFGASIVLTLAVLSFRLFIVDTKLGPTWGGLIGGCVSGISIVALNLIWKQLAMRLTVWENHRTHQGYENSLIIKIFLFYFINNYTSLYYIAFFKNGNRFWNSNDSSLKDTCDMGYHSPYTVSGGCPEELTMQLGTILFINIFSGQATQVILPWVLGKINVYLFQRSTHENVNDLPQWERESKRPDYAGPFYDYNQLVIQYGYIVLFSSAFPLASVMALINNVIEIRTNGFKMIYAYTRPHYRGAANIGSWYMILEALGIIAVVTNALLIGLTFPTINELFGGNPFASLGVAMILEHFIMFVKYLISALIPDYPGWLSTVLARQAYIKEQIIIKDMEAREIREWEIEHEGSLSDSEEQ